MVAQQAGTQTHTHNESERKKKHFLFPSNPMVVVKKKVPHNLHRAVPHLISLVGQLGMKERAKSCELRLGLESEMTLGIGLDWIVVEFRF